MRHALYLTPSASHPVTRLAAGWLGRDVFDKAGTGGDMEGGIEAVPPADLPASIDESGWGRLTAGPRRYGFHGTIVAPFRLVGPLTIGDLRAKLDGFCRRRRGFRAALAVGTVGSFVALLPATSSEAIESLAADAVRDFAPCEAPLTVGERQKHRSRDLTTRQSALLDAYGYPYVLDQFRFHMRLTGPIEDEGQRQEMAVHLGARFAEALREPVAFDALHHFVEPEPDRPFQVLDTRRFGTRADAEENGAGEAAAA